MSSSRSNGRECGLPLGVFSPGSPGCVHGCTVDGCLGRLPGAAVTVWIQEGAGVTPVSTDAGKRTDTAAERACDRGRVFQPLSLLAYANEMQMGRDMSVYANEM